MKSGPASYAARQTRKLRDRPGFRFDNPRESAIYCRQVLLPGENPVIERSARQPAAAEAPIVFVVDDDESVREALRSLFRSVSLRVETFGSAAEFLRSELPAVASCLVLDVRLPGVSGLDFQAELAIKHQTIARQTRRTIGSPVPAVHSARTVAATSGHPHSRRAVSAVLAN